MIFGVVADIHGNFDAMHAAMARHPDVPYWLCVGDLASRAGAYPEPIAPLYWIKGNNDNFDAIEYLRERYAAHTQPALHSKRDCHAYRRSGRGGPRGDVRAERLRHARGVAAARERTPGKTW